MVTVSNPTLPSKSLYLTTPLQRFSGFITTQQGPAELRTSTPKRQAPALLSAMFFLVSGLADFVMPALRSIPTTSAAPVVRAVEDKKDEEAPPTIATLYSIDSEGRDPKPALKYLENGDVLNQRGKLMGRIEVLDGIAYAFDACGNFIAVGTREGQVAEITAAQGEFRYDRKGNLIQAPRFQPKIFAKLGEDGQTILSRYDRPRDLSVEVNADTNVQKSEKAALVALFDLGC
jgi:hypothetical protein